MGVTAVILICERKLRFKIYKQLESGLALNLSMREDESDGDFPQTDVKLKMVKDAIVLGDCRNGLPLLTEVVIVLLQVEKETGGLLAAVEFRVAGAMTDAADEKLIMKLWLCLKLIGRVELGYKEMARQFGGAGMMIQALMLAMYDWSVQELSSAGNVMLSCRGWCCNVQVVFGSYILPGSEMSLPWVLRVDEFRERGKANAGKEFRYCRKYVVVEQAKLALQFRKTDRLSDLHGPALTGPWLLVG
ncbi:hypothetical protein C5167_003705 [Papaver somniferum]|uniref:Uncharacterized protein n=1 Tax=Papaver somniferum TaxID=3469 RepID=A0A4Y7L4C9_PAPSO|nr:hypothetical protein C5167_003705 [Papaver somniferum]